MGSPLVVIRFRLQSPSKNVEIIAREDLGRHVREQEAAFLKTLAQLWTCRSLVTYAARLFFAIELGQGQGQQDVLH